MEKIAMSEDGGRLERDPGARDTKKCGNGVRWLLVVICVFFVGAVVWQTFVEMYRLSLRVDRLERVLMTAASSGQVNVHDFDWPTSNWKEDLGSLPPQPFVPLSAERYDLEPGGDVYASEETTSLSDETTNNVNVEQLTPLGRRTKRSLDQHDLQDDMPHSAGPRRNPARNHRTAQTDTGQSAGHSDHPRRHRHHEVAYQMTLDVALNGSRKESFDKGVTIHLPYGEYGPSGFRPSKISADDNSLEVYPYKMWKTADWALRSSLFHHNAEKGQIVVTKNGVYFIYAQLLYCNLAVRSGFAIKTNEASPVILARCWTSTDIVGSSLASSNGTASPRLKTCYVGVSAMLNANQQVWLEDLYGTFIKPDADANFFGIIRLGE